MISSEVDKAERSSRARAVLMALGGIVIAIAATLRASDQASTAAALSWIVLILLWSVLLASGGGIRMGGRMRALINDELSQANRARALGTGFFAGMLAAAVVLVVNINAPVGTQAAIEYVTAAAMAAALLRYAWLEWH